MQKFDIWTPSNLVSVIDHMWGGNGCGLVLATHTQEVVLAAKS